MAGTATLTVLTSSGFGWYNTGDIGNANFLASGAVHNATLSQAVNLGSGHGFKFIGTGFTYDANKNFTGGQISEIDFYDPTFATKLATVVFSNGTIDAAALTTAIASFKADPQNSNAVSSLLSDFSWVEQGGAGDDLLPSYHGADSFVGGGGFDSVSYLHSDSAVTANLADSSQNTGAAAGDTYNGIWELIGTNYDDTLIGDANQNRLEGGAGADTLIGGGSGIDYAGYQHAASGVTASLADPGVNTGDAAGDTYINISRLVGSDYNDVLIGDDNNNFLRGRAGADELHGGGGFDFADYTAAPVGVRADLTNPFTNTGVAAGDTYDSIEGLRGSDLNDILKGDTGNNTLTGQKGADRFIYTAGTDVITDFNHAEGDKIDLAGSGVTSWSALQSLLSQSGANAKIDFGGGNSITLNNVTASNLTQGDFILDPGPSTATLTVLTSSGFGWYNTGDIGNANFLASGAVHNATLSQAVNLGSGHGFKFIGTGFTYDANKNFTGGQISEIDFYDPTFATKLATVVFSNGTIDAAALTTAIASFKADPQNSNAVSSLLSDFSWVEQGGAGDDLLPSYHGADSFVGGGGFDSVSYLHSDSAVTANLADSSQNTGAAAGDTYNGIWELIGTNYDDTLIGDANQNRLEGGAGADTLIGGGSGIDYAGYQHAASGVTASLADPGVNTGDAAGDTYINISRLVGSDYNDVLIGDDNNNFLRGRAGADELHGGGGFDFADYTAAPVGVRADLTNPFTNTGVAAGDTYDSIEGLRGSDLNDILKGDTGNNTLTGQKGADRFIYTAGTDVITDFNHAEGDKIDLAGSGVTSWSALQSLLSQSGANAKIDFGGGNSITLNNVTASNLTQGDFILDPDITAPTVQDVSSVPGSGTSFALNETAIVKISLGEAVTVTGSPVLQLSDGETAAYSAAASDLANGILAFSYKAGTGRSTSDMQITSVTLGSAKVTDLSGNTADLTLTSGQADLGWVIDTQTPTVSSVTSPTAPGTPVPLGGIGSQPIAINVAVSEDIVVAGTGLTLKLSDGEIATFDAADSTSTNLVFNYTPTAGHNTADLKVTGLVLASGTTVKDTAGNALTVTGAANKDLGIVIDTVAPMVKDSLKSDTGTSKTDKITSDATLTGTGDVNATVHFNVDGSDVGNTATADNKGVWTISGADLGLSDGAHTIIASETDAAGNTGSATLTFTVDTTAPSVQDVSSVPGSGTSFALNETAIVKISLGEAVTVTGSPVLQLSDGETAAYSAAASDLANGILAFSYKAGTGRSTSDMQITSVTLGSAKVTDLSGNTADLTLTSGQADLGWVIDTQTPTVSSVTSPTAPGTPVPLGGIGSQPIAINVAVSEDIVVAGTGLTLKLSDGEIATFDAADSTSTNLVFNYTPTAGHNTADLKVTGLVLASGTTVKDTAGNALTVTGAANKDLGIIIDTVAPMVKDSLKSDTGTSKTDKITSDATLTGTGDVNATVHFNVDGSDVGNTATADNKGVWTISGADLGLSDGAHTIIASETDAAGNTGTAMFSFTLDTTAPAPVATDVSSAPGSGGRIGTGGTVIITLDLGEAVTVTGKPTLALSNGGVASYIAASSHLASGPVAFSYKVAAGQDTGDLTVDHVVIPSGASVKDLAGNVADFTGVVGADLDLTIDTMAPTITIVTGAPGSGMRVALGDTITIDLTTSEAVNVIGAPTLKLSDGGVATYDATHSTATTLEFDYVTKAGQNTLDLKVTSLTLPTGSLITDTAGNAVILTGAANKDLGIVVDTTLPTVKSITATPSHPGPLVNGDAETFTLHTSEQVNVDAGVTLTLNDGAHASYVSGTGTDTIVFNYTIGAESSADLKVLGIDQSGGGFTDLAGNAITAAVTLDTKTAVNAYTWKGGAGDFTDTTHWTQAEVPPPGAIVQFAAGAYTVEVPNNGEYHLAGLTVGKGVTFAVDGSDLVVAFDGDDQINSSNAGVIDFVTFSAEVEFAHTTLANTGTINVGAHGFLEFNDVILNGGGKIILNGGDVVAAGSTGPTLTNVDNTISGAGTFGDDQLTIGNSTKGIANANDAGGGVLHIDALAFSNAGLVEATGHGVLEIDSDITNLASGLVKAAAAGAHVNLDDATISGGKISTVAGSFLDSIGGSSTISTTNALVNAGRLGAEQGDLTVTGGVTNSGKLDANGHILDIAGNVTGAGTATIENGGTLEFGDASSAKVTFGAGSGTLILDQATTAAHKFTGNITGFDSDDHIVLGAIGFVAAGSQLAYNSTTHVLTIHDNAGHTEMLTFTAAVAGDFHAQEYIDPNAVHTGHVDLFLS